MKSQFEFLFDVGAPNAYLVHKVLPEFCSRHGAHVTYKPILLGGVFKATGNRAPMVRYADAPAKLAYEQLEFRRFLETHRLNSFRFNPHFPVNSLLAMRTIAAAEGSDVFVATIDALMSGMWEDGLDLGQPEIVISALENKRLDGVALVAQANNPDTKARLADQTDEAIRRGVFGVPTFFVGEEMFWGKERLVQVAEALAS